MNFSKENEVKLTIVIPVYNTENYLETCIKSILKQSYTNFEIILVDDGSTDLSTKICEQYLQQDKRVKFIKQEHKGIGAARVAGIKASTGNYIAFVDSDDWMDTSAFERLMHPFESDDNIDISICSFVVYSKRGHTYMCQNASENAIKYTSYEALEIMFSGAEYNWSLCGKVYKKILFEKGDDFYDTWPPGYGEDTYINWQIFKNVETVAYIPMPYYHYRFNPTSTMHQSISYKKLIYFDIWREILGDIENINSKLAQNVLNVVFSYGVSVLMEFIEMGILRNEHWYEKRNLLSKYINFYSKKDDSNFQRKFNRLMLSDKEIKEEKNKYLNKLRHFCDTHHVIYIYGAGRIAEELANIMKNENIRLEGFIVSSIDDNANSMLEYDVYEISDDIISNKKNVGIVMGLNERNYEKVMHSGYVDNYEIFNGGRISMRY